MADRHERQELAAFALGLLDEADRARMEAHVRACAECAAELSQHRAVTALLQRELPRETPPNEAWAAISARTGERAAQRAGASSWPVTWAKMTRVLQPALVAALTAAVIGLIGWNASLQVRLSHHETTISGLAKAPGETVVALAGPSTASGLGGHLVMSESKRQGGLVVAGLPALLAGRSYQVWFVRPDQTRVSAGTFQADSLGQAITVIAVPQPESTFDGVAISEEPQGGSASPTSPDLLAAPLYEQ